MTLPYLRKSGSYRYVSPQNISQISEESHRSIKGLSSFEDWTENPRVGGSIPPLATIKSRTWARRSNISCEISSHRGINISQAEQVGASKPLLAIDNCLGHKLKRRTNPTFVSLLCPGKLLAQRTRLHSAAHSGCIGRDGL